MPSNHKLRSLIHILENQGPTQLPNNTNWGVNWRTGQCPLKVPTNDSHSSKHKDNYFYGHSSRTLCNSLRQDTNLFPQKHNLMKLYNHIFIFKEIQFHNLNKNIIKTKHNSTQNTFTSFSYFITQSEFLRSSTMAFSYLMYGLNTQIIHNYTK